MESASIVKELLYLSQTKIVYDLQLLFHFPTIASTNTKFQFVEKITCLFYVCLCFLSPNPPITKRIACLSSNLVSYCNEQRRIFNCYENHIH